MIGLNLNILVVDDHKMVCEAMAALIEKSGITNIVRTAINAHQALEIIKTKCVHVALIDARMPGISGIALSAIILKEHTHVKIIGMTSFDEDDTVVEMLQIGVHGILLKRNTSGAEINRCLQEVYAGRKFFSCEILAKLSQNEYNLRKAHFRFTRRESEILKLIAEGQSTKQVAAILQLKDSTVEDYRKEMLCKTGAKNTAELIAITLRNGLL